MITFTRYELLITLAIQIIILSRSNLTANSHALSHLILIIPSTKCKRKPDKSVVDLLYQKHLYCSVEKPLFESDPEILKISEA